MDLFLAHRFDSSRVFPYDAKYMKVILASQSPYRKQQLEHLGLKFKAEKPLVDEEKLKHEFAESYPAQLAGKLARAKAESLKEKYPDALIIGADQLVQHKGEVLGKTENFDNAFRQLKNLQGDTHELLTAICCLYQGKVFEKIISARLKMRRLDDAMIKSYLELDEPYDCAGSYKVEKAGSQLFDFIACPDFTAIQGLPLMALSESFLYFGLPLPCQVGAE